MTEAIDGTGHRRIAGTIGARRGPIPGIFRRGEDRQTVDFLMNEFLNFVF